LPYPFWKSRKVNPAYALELRNELKNYNPHAGPLGLRPNLLLTKHVDIDVDSRGVWGDS